MKIQFNISKKIEKAEILEKIKLTLFDCMVKMHELAVINCPVDTGALVNSIKLFPSVPGATTYELADGVTYGIDIEFGTAPHVIMTKNKKVLANKKKGLIFGKIVNHPGTTAQPFFRPALDQVKNVWVKRFWYKNLK